MSTELFEQIIIGFSAVVLAGLVWTIAGKKNGLSREAMRDIVALVIVVAALLCEVFCASGASSFMRDAFMLVMGGWLFSKMGDGKPDAKPDATKTISDTKNDTAAPAEIVPAKTSSQGGYVSVWQMIAMGIPALVLLATLLTSSGCGSMSASTAAWLGSAGGFAAGNAGSIVKAGQAGVDKLAESTKTSQEVAVVRAAIAKAEAEKAGLVLLPHDATEFPVEYRELATDRVITGGVYVRHVYETRTVLAPATAAPAPLSTPESTNQSMPPSSPVPTQPAVGNSLPPPGSATAPIQSGGSSGGISSGRNGTTDHTDHTDSASSPSVASVNSVVEIQNYSVEGRVVSAQGALASAVSTATFTAEVSARGAPGFAENGGPVSLSGHVTSLANAFPLDVSRLHFAGFTGMVASGVLVVASTPGGDVQFEGSARLADGSIHATLLPTVGTAACAFFQSLELSGTATLVESTTATNGGAGILPAADPNAGKDARATSGPVLHSVQKSGDKRISWDVTGIDGWKSENNVFAWLCVNGVNVEMVRPGSNSQSLKNAFGVGGSHNVRVKKGETCRIKLKAMFGKQETNEVEFVWPFEDTQT